MFDKCLQDSNNEHLDRIARQFSSMFDLCGPMRGCPVTQGRHLFMEGDLKFKDNANKVNLVKIFFYCI